MEWKDKNENQAAALDADQVEWSAVVRKVVPIESALTDDVMDGSLADEADTEANREESTALCEDRMQEDVILRTVDEIERRICVMNGDYPFRLEDRSRLVYQPSKTLAYEFCLAISLHLKSNSETSLRYPRAFEMLSLIAMIAMLSPDSDGVRIGWPRMDRSRFKDAVDDVYSRVGQWRFRSAEFLPDDPAPQDVKDATVDLIAWKNIGDSRQSRMFVAGQCACGNDWKNKTSDLRLDSLSKWCEFPLSTTLRAFFLPFHIPNEPRLKEVSWDAGLTLDRARIAKILEGSMHAPVVLEGETTKNLLALALR